MERPDVASALLARIYGRLENILTQYAANCSVADKPREISRSGELDRRKARLRLRTLTKQLHYTLDQMAELSPSMPQGILAQNRAVQLCHRYHLSECEELHRLTRSHLRDVEKFLCRFGEVSLPVSSAGTPHQAPYSTDRSDVSS